MRSTSVSAASQRRKLEEQNAQAVRKFLFDPENKFCFECGQRGPTYVNLTIGSSCCMHCSGLLRGLNPPHRVKSISMATFTTDEVERLKTLGNAVNTQIWLGLYDGRKKFEPRVEEDVRIHMIDKYENKKWYVSASDVEQQKRLLDEHANSSQRRNSLSGVSHKSNQSAPANLHFAQGRSGPIDLLTGDLFDLSVSTPTQTPQSHIPASVLPSINPPKPMGPMDDWTTLFSSPAPPQKSFPLNPPEVPAPLKFPQSSGPSSQFKNGTDGFFSESPNGPKQPNLTPHAWESFSTPMPKSATVGGLSAPSSSVLDDLFGAEENRPTDQRKTRPPVPSVGPVVLGQAEDPFGSTTPFTPNVANWTAAFPPLQPPSKKKDENSDWNPFL